MYPFPIRNKSVFLQKLWIDLYFYKTVNRSQFYKVLHSTHFQMKKKFMHLSISPMASGCKTIGSSCWNPYFPSLHSCNSGLCLGFRLWRLIHKYVPDIWFLCRFYGAVVDGPWDSLRVVVPLVFPPFLFFLPLFTLAPCLVRGICNVCSVVSMTYNTSKFDSIMLNFKCIYYVLYIR